MAAPGLLTPDALGSDLAPAELDAAAEPLLPAEGPNSASAWHGRISEARELLKFHRDKFNWNTNVLRYAGKGGDDAKTPTGLDGKSVALLPKDYAYTEQKKPLLFYQLPEVVLSPARGDVSADVAQLFAAVLNDMVGPTQINALPTINEILTDVLVPAGIGIAKLTYEAYVDPNEPEIDTQTGTKPRIDPLTGGQAIDPMSGAPLTDPVMERVPNIIREKYGIDRLSPIDFLYDAGFRGSDWRKCSWVGGRYRLAPHAVTSLYGVPEGELKRKGEQSIAPDEAQSLAPDRIQQRFGGVEVIEIYYHGVDYDPTIGDPDQWMCLVFVEGIEAPVKHDVSYAQVVKGGRVVSGLRRAPLFPLTLHYVSDMALPPSDCSMSRTIVDELSKGRTQMWEQRDRNVPLRGLDISKVTTDQREKIRNGRTQEIIMFDGLLAGESPIFGITQTAFPQENFNFNNIGERDLQEAWALSGANLGSQEVSGRTATELSLRQQGTENRMGAEQVKVELWWISIVEALGALVQEFADMPAYVAMVGQDGARKIAEWTKQQIAGEFAFSVRPDSSKRVDQAAERKFRLDGLNLMINIPGINKGELVKWAAPSLGLDPAKIIEQPKEPPPEPPKITLTVDTLSLNPASPEYANVAAILASKGITLVTPQFGTGVVPGAVAPPAPPGGAPGAPGAPVVAGGGAPPVNKHAADETGQLPGAGAAGAPA